MTKKKSMLIIPAIVLVFGMAVNGCDNGANDNSNITNIGGGTQWGIEIIDIAPADSQLTVLWKAVEGCESYEVFLDGEKHSETLATLKKITGLSNGQKYYVQIQANVNNKLIKSELKSVTPMKDVAPPATPEEIKITADDKALSVSWLPVNGANSYVVYVNNNLYAEVSEPQVEINGLENDVSYSVQIQSKNSVGTSASSGAVYREPNQYIKKAAIGMGFNLFGSLTSSSISLRPILNLNKLNQDNIYIIEDENKSSWSVRSGTSIKQVNVGQNQSISMGASMPFQGILLSAGGDGGYRQNSVTTTQTHYALIRVEHFIKTVAINPMFCDTDKLLGYLTDGFLYALDHESASELFSHYGHALLLKYRLGGNQEIYVTHFNYQNETYQSFRTAINTEINVLANIFGASVKGETSSSTSTSEWRKNSEIYFSSSGGALSKALTLESVFDQYSSWVDSIEAFPNFAGVESYLNSYIPLWDIAKMLGKHELARALKEEFIRQGMKRVDNLESIWPGEWFTYDEKIYSPGTATFNHPVKYITDDDGNKVAVDVVYEFYLGGGGGPGSGSLYWSDNGQLDGGSGSGGAAMRLKLRSNQGLTAYLQIGKGGQGNPESLGTANLKPGRTQGEDSTVTIYNQTFTAQGGQYAPYSSKTWYHVPGGIGLPLYPPDFVYDYEIANGGDAPAGNATKPGAGGKIGLFQAGSGGCGGISSHGGHSGSPGGDGSIIVRYYYYDGQ